MCIRDRPDAYILCVNTTDDMDYIKRTIQFLSSFTNSKVISLVVFPLIYKNEEGYLTDVVGTVDNEYMQIFILELEAEFGINTYSLEDPMLLQNLHNEIISFYS